MKIETPEQLVFDQIRDLVSVEHQLESEWSSLASESRNELLEKLLSSQGPMSRTRHDRLVELCNRRGEEPGNDKSKAMEGLIEGGNAHIQIAGSAVKDLILIAHASRVLAYQYAGYGFASALAVSMGFSAEAEYLGDVFYDINTALSDMTLLGKSLLIGWQPPME